MRVLKIVNTSMKARAKMAAGQTPPQWPGTEMQTLEMAAGRIPPQPPGTEMQTLEMAAGQTPPQPPGTEMQTLEITAGRIPPQPPGTEMRIRRNRNPNPTDRRLKATAMVVEKDLCRWNNPCLSLNPPEKEDFPEKPILP